MLEGLRLPSVLLLWQCWVSDHIPPGTNGDSLRNAGDIHRAALTCSSSSFTPPGPRGISLTSCNGYLSKHQKKNEQVHFLKWGCSPSSWGAELGPHRFTERAPRMPHQAFPHPKLTWEWNRTRLSCQGISALWIKTEDSRSQRYPNILKKWKHLSQILTKELLDSKSPFNPWLFTIIFLSYSEQNNRVIRDKLH